MFSLMKSLVSHFFESSLFFTHRLGGLSVAMEIIQGKIDESRARLFKSFPFTDAEGAVFVLPMLSTDHEEVFNQFVPDIRSYFVHKGTDLTVCRSKNKQVKYDVRHSADVILPLLFVAEKLLLPVVLGILSSYIYDKYHRARNTTVQIEVITLSIESNEFRHLKITGNGEEVANTLKVLSNQGEVINVENGSQTKTSE